MFVAVNSPLGNHQTPGGVTMNTISKTLLLCGAGLAAALPASTWAQNELEEFPDIHYGLWETTTTTSMWPDESTTVWPHSCCYYSIRRSVLSLL